MRTIVMTGASSGLGRIAAERLVAAPGVRLLTGARGEARPGVEHLPLDLSRLDGVRRFTDAVVERLGDDAIDGLVLNAGTNAGRGDHRTPEGFELTFVVNHLAHVLLIERLRPRLSPGAVVVLTTSGTHDPAERTIIPPPRHAEARLLAWPEKDPDRDLDPWTAAGRAYSSSKLCVLLAARGLAASAQARDKGLSVVAYDPGLTPGTGLVRNSGWPVQALWWLLGTPFAALSPAFNTRAAAGAALADLALEKVRPPPGRVYAALRRGRITWPEPSDLARRDDLVEDVRRDSLALLALAARRAEEGIPG